ncbi:MAG: hypothetical protein JWR53_927 [Glaciihabitans sp.]|jgi:hypothetical protein|nr:hypothetical protein [Glaciihabitans sp.]
MPDRHTLRARVPGQSVMSELVRSQLDVPPRSRLARFFGASPLSAANRGWYSGALGELLVGDSLDDIGPEWDVLHAVPLGDERDDSPDIDHVVIGPPGVFTIHTKNYTGEDVTVLGETMLAGGERLPHVFDARDEAERAASLLSDASGVDVVVEPIIVIVNPKKLTIRQQPAGVVVISSHQLLRWLTRLDRTLDGEAVALISDVADRTATWHSSPSPAQDTQQLHRDFAVLRAQVGRAAARRAFWVGSLFIAVFAGAWVSVATLVSVLLGRA